MKNKFILLSAIVCSAMCVQASSLTTLAQCSVPIVSGVTGYKSWQDLRDQNKLQQRLQERGEIKKDKYLQKTLSLDGSPSKRRIDHLSSFSLLTASTSIALAGLSVYHKKEAMSFELSTELAFCAAFLSTTSVASYFYSHKKFIHAKEVANAMPGEVDIESQQPINSDNK